MPSRYFSKSAHILVKSYKPSKHGRHSRPFKKSKRKTEERSNRPQRYAVETFSCRAPVFAGHFTDVSSFTLPIRISTPLQKGCQTSNVRVAHGTGKKLTKAINSICGEFCLHRAEPASAAGYDATGGNDFYYVFFFWSLLPKGFEVYGRSSNCGVGRKHLASADVCREDCFLPSARVATLLGGRSLVLW